VKNVQIIDEDVIEKIENDYVSERLIQVLVNV
jgi:hypothetical protein